MRIAIDARELLPDVRTGIGRYLRNFLEATIPAHKETAFILIGNQHTEFGDYGDNVEKIQIQETGTAVFDQQSLPAAATESSADVLFSPFDKGPVRSACPVVITIHDLTPLLEPGQTGLKRTAYKAAYKMSRRLYAKRAATVITDSEHSKTDIVSFFGIDENKVIPVPIGVPASYQPASPEAVKAATAKHHLDKPFILYVGNFKPHKNVKTLVEAYRAFPTEWLDRVDLALCGGSDVYRQELEAEISGSALSDRVKFLGFVPDEDMPGLYGGAAMLSFPSLYEGFGLPPLEAMACGAPVVCSNATSLPEVVGDAGILIDANGPDEIRTAMLRVLQEDGLREDLITRGKMRVENFTPKQTAEQVYEILKQAAGREI